MLNLGEGDWPRESGEDWLPTADNINALPTPLRGYIHELIAMCDPAGLVIENAQMKDVVRELEASNRQHRDAAAKPIDMVLHCPACGIQHIDAPETDEAYTERLHESSWWELGSEKPERWTNPPHRSHLCHNPECGHTWRPADVPTNGVRAVQTKGKNDSLITGLKPNTYVVLGVVYAKLENARKAAWNCSPVKDESLPIFGYRRTGPVK